jgi:predicted nucleic acid-binding Zn ribbon protein
MDYEQSVQRCKQLICNHCGLKLRPIRNDKEERTAHNKCTEILDKQIRHLKYNLFMKYLLSKKYNNL